MQSDACSEDSVAEAVTLSTVYPRLLEYFHTDHTRNRVALVAPDFYGCRLRERYVRIPFSLTYQDLVQRPSVVTVTADQVRRWFIQCPNRKHEHEVYVLYMDCMRVEHTNLVEDLTVGIEMESTEPSLDPLGSSRLMQWWGRCGSSAVQVGIANTYPVMVSGRSGDINPISLRTPLPLSGALSYEALRGCLTSRQPDTWTQDSRVLIVPSVPNAVFNRLLEEHLPEQHSLVIAQLNASAKTRGLMPQDFYTQAVQGARRQMEESHTLWRGETRFKCHLLGDDKAWESVFKALEGLPSLTGTKAIKLLITIRVQAIVIGTPQLVQ